MQINFTLFRRLWIFCSEDCGYFVPKIVGASFRKLWLFYSEDCGFLFRKMRLPVLPIIKILANTTRLRLTYGTQP